MKGGKIKAMKREGVGRMEKRKRKHPQHTIKSFEIISETSMIISDILNVTLRP